MEKRTRFSPPAVGGSSLLVIFALLALSVFAVLSLSTAKAESRLADTSAQAVSAYYAADLQAERIFSMLRNGQTAAQVQETDGNYCYTCPISENRRLEVRLRCENGVWEVLRWQAVAEAEPEIRETLNVWDGSIS